MKSGKLFIVSILILLTSFIAISSKAEEVTLYTENFKPYQYINEEGALKGFGIDLVESMFQKAGIGIKDEIRMAIWDSAYQTALQEENAGIFMTVRNKKRENIFKWVGPLASREMWLYKLTSRKDIKADTLSDAKKYLVGGYKSAQTDYLIELGFPLLDIVLKEELNFKKLMAGRIDLMPSSEIMMASKLKDQGIPLDTVTKVIIFDNRFQYYLALNKSVPDETVAKLQNALDYLKNSGRYQQMENKYLNPLK